MYMLYAICFRENSKYMSKTHVAKLMHWQKPVLHMHKTQCKVWFNSIIRLYFMKLLSTIVIEDIDVLKKTYPK